MAICGYLLQIVIQTKTSTTFIYFFQMVHGNNIILKKKLNVGTKVDVPIHVYTHKKTMQ